MKHLYHYLQNLCILLTLSSSCLVARNTYMDYEISPENIIEFIEPLPEDAAPVLDWINKHAEDLRYLAATPSPLSRWADKKYYGKQCLKRCGIENRGSNNFVFKIPNTCWWIKISGPLRRLINLYVYNTGQNPFSTTEYKLHKEFSNSALLNSFTIVPTYQTISRFANSLRCKDVILRNTIDRIYFPEIYLVHIPGNPTDISDDNYIIVEKEVADIENICDNDRANQALTKQTLKELYYIITEAGIFDFNGENLRIDDHNNLVFIDLEQAIVENPIDFYNKNKEIFDLRVFHGIRSFVNVHLSKYSKEYDVIKSLVMADTSLRESVYWDDYKKLFKVRERRLHYEESSKKKLDPQSFAASLIKYPVDTNMLLHIEDSNINKA